MNATIRTLSLGAGVQSTTIYLLACEGVIPPFDAAIFADTGWEPRRVYEHLERLERYGAEARRYRSTASRRGTSATTH